MTPPLWGEPRGAWSWGERVLVGLEAVALVVAVLQALVANHAEMQKIVSFTNAFESLFKIIADEGGAEGSIVVEDCLAVIAHLVRNEVSQRSFREMGCGVCAFLTPVRDNLAIPVGGFYVSGRNPTPPPLPLH